MKSGLPNTTPVSQESINQTTSIPVEKVVAAVELLVDIGLSLTTSSPHTRDQFDAAKADAMAFLKEQNIRIDLLEGNYEAALRTLASSFIEKLYEEKIKAKVETGKEKTDEEKENLEQFLSRSGITISLLARLRKQSKFADRIERNSEQKELDGLVKAFISKNDKSPAGAISILRAYIAQ